MTPELNETQIKTLLRKWILEQGSPVDPALLTDDADCVETGFLDSLGVMSLITYVEEIRGDPLTETELAIDNFVSIKTIVDALFPSVRTQ